VSINPNILSIVGSLVTIFRGINEAHPEILAAATKHLPFHNGLVHVLSVDLPAVLGVEATAHVAPDTPVHVVAGDDGSLIASRPIVQGGRVVGNETVADMHALPSPDRAPAPSVAELVEAEVQRRMAAITLPNIDTIADAVLTAIAKREEARRAAHDATRDPPGVTQASPVS
jgi:hypothetical protein